MIIVLHIILIAACPSPHANASSAASGGALFNTSASSGFSDKL